MTDSKENVKILVKLRSSGSDNVEHAAEENLYKYSLVYLTRSLESERTRKPIGLKQKHLRNQTSPAAYL